MDERYHDVPLNAYRQEWQTIYEELNAEHQALSAEIRQLRVQWRLLPVDERDERLHTEMQTVLGEIRHLRHGVQELKQRATALRQHPA